MQYKNIVAGAAVLLASAQTAVALGTATVINNCGFPVYYSSVGGSSNPSMAPLENSYSQGYSSPGTGFSIKLSPNQTTYGSVSQFEFTWADGKIAYDLSNIDGYPFVAGGMEIVPSMQNDPNNPTCVPVTCPAGVATCTAAYNAPDDVRTMVCSDESDLTLTICPGGSFKRSVTYEDGHIHYRVHARHMPKLA
ncbi:hypothetical protein PV08_08397 [Exophiala spinifera]|uniref:Antigenic thaumatin-like protein n=1 Tax=Exophiala spinifera TaxID=91928 RepID=A0A0D2B3H8_9EURO|nr:uncharacterized protein PV08_08397 [Exophiala spinifera]KIW13210.1 hypothetical protein PV08_08397 [Exophiala spinifera]